MRRMSVRPAQHPDPDPLETNDVLLVTIGTIAWAAALLVLLVLRLADRGDVRGWWLGMCGYGIALGLFGIRYCRRRQWAIAREAVATGPSQGMPEAC